MSGERALPETDAHSTQTQNIGSPFDNLTPWLFVAMWYAIRPLTVEAGAVDLPLTGGLVHPLVWELIWLVTVAGLIGVAKLLAHVFANSLARIFIALGTYIAIPYAVAFLKTVVAPPAINESYYSQFPESLILSLGIGVIAVAWASPLAKLKTLELALDRATKELVGLQRSVLEQKQTAQQNLDGQLQSVVAPEVEKVVDILRRGSLTQARIDQLSSQIHTSVSDVLRPFARRLINDSSLVTHEPAATRASALRRLGFFEPITVRNTLQPVLLGSIPAAWLSIVWARDLSLSWPESLYLFFFTASLVALVTLLGWGIKAMIPRGFRIHPVIALAAAAAITATLTYLPIAIITNVPPDFLGYETWGYTTTFPAAALTIAVICPLLAMGGVLIARQLDVVQRKELAQQAIAEHNAALNTELWHLQRQTALMVHGRVQSALISTGLRMSAGSDSENDPAAFIDLLEKTLSDARLGDTPGPLSDFVESLAELWDGVATVTSHLSPTAMELLERSPASLMACCELVREGISNAIFHGSATEITVTVMILRDNTVHTRIEDNGSGPVTSRTPGVGSNLLNTVSSGWNLLRIGDTTVLTANLFIPRETSAHAMATQATQGRPVAGPVR